MQREGWRVPMRIRVTEDGTVEDGARRRRRKKKVVGGLG
jgi:hypothetical protein